MQSGRHLIELLAAFGLTAIIGLERTIQQSRRIAILRVCGQRNWQLTELDADDGYIDRAQVGVTMTLSGNGIANAAEAPADIDGVSAVFNAEDEPD